MPYFNETVPLNFEGSERLDKFLASIPGAMNRSRLKSGVLEILINDKKAKLNSKVKAGDKIFFQWEDSIPEDIEPQNLPLSIIYEDENVTVVNKRQGMVTHPAAGNWDGTLVNALLYHWGREAVPQKKNENSEIFESRRPGIVHRLDKDTSGVIITAKNRDTEVFLGSQFKNHRALSKIYICICQGHPPVREGLIRTNLVRDSHDRKRFKAVDLEGSGKLAITKFKCLACYGPYSLMKVKIYTGRTHQIRVHLKFIGCPILGDKIYSKAKSTVFDNPTLMLHAYKLKIKIPGKSEKAVFVAGVPARFKKVLKTLHESFKKTFPPESIDKKLPSVKTGKNPRLLVFEAKKGYGQWQK